MQRRDTDTRSSTPALFVCRDPHCVAPVRAILLYPAGDVPTQMDTRYTSVALTGNGNFVSTLYFDAFSGELMQNAVHLLPATMLITALHDLASRGT